MASINPIIRIQNQGSYVPYFYDAGLFMHYNPNDPYRSQAPAPSRYDFSSELPIWPRYDGHQTVEQIIERGYFAVPKGEPETAVISDKQHIAGIGLDDVIRQIHHRVELYQQNMYDIALSICEAANSVHRQEGAQGRPADNRQMYSEQKQVQKLYEQQRDERVNLWRDVSRLRLGLPENLQSYLSAYRKLSMLNDSSDKNDPGGSF